MIISKILLNQQNNDALDTGKYMTGGYFKFITLNPAFTNLYIGTAFPSLNDKYIYKLIEWSDHRYIEHVVMTDTPWDIRDPQAVVIPLITKTIPFTVQDDAHAYVHIPAYSQLNIAKVSEDQPITSGTSFSSNILDQYIDHFDSNYRNPGLADYLREFKANNPCIEKMTDTDNKFLERTSDRAKLLNDNNPFTTDQIFNYLAATLDNDYWSCIRNDEPIDFLNQTLHTAFTPWICDSAYSSRVTDMLTNGPQLPGRDFLKRSVPYGKLTHPKPEYIPPTGIKAFEYGPSYTPIQYTKEFASVIEAILRIDLTDFVIDYDYISYKHDSCDGKFVFALNRYHPDIMTDQGSRVVLEFCKRELGYKILDWFLVNYSHDYDIASIKVYRTFNEEVFFSCEVYGDTNPTIFYCNLIEGILATRDILHDTSTK